MNETERLKAEIQQLEAEIRTTEMIASSLREQRLAKVDERAALIAPVKAGDRIKFNAGYYNTSDNLKEGVVEFIQGTYADGFTVYYRQVLKGGKISTAVRRVWDARKIFERNGQPIEIKIGGF